MFSLPFIGTIVVLVGFMLIQLTLDSIRRRNQAKITRDIMNLGKQKAELSINVIVRANGRQHEVTALLDHLKSHGYPKLQVVVIPRSRSNKRAGDYLRRYQKDNPELAVRIVTTSGRVDDRSIVTKYTRSGLMVWLSADSRLSKKFFARLSYEFIDSNVTQLLIPHLVRPAGSIASLVTAWTVIRHQTFGLLRSRYAHAATTVVLRSAYLKKADAAPPRLARLSFGLVTPYKAAPNDWIKTTINVLLTGVFVTLFILLLNSEWLFILAALLAVYATMNILWMLPLRGFSALDRLVLIIGVPFSIISAKNRK